MMIAKRPTPEAKADKTTIAARLIIEADKKKQDAKTTKLRNARLAKEAADLLAHAPGQPRAKVLKAKDGKRGLSSGS